MSASISRFNCQIRGQVQGVGYRNFVLHHASRLGLSGFVRNKDDGGVEVEAQGDLMKLEKLVELLRKGPSHGTVDEVMQGSIPVRLGEIDFRIEW